ncbi:MAG: Holliday junction branch migration protein RuvA [bacterium]|nr:Holliday junction branch migration protein RuvA [bacterium]
MIESVHGRLLAKSPAEAVIDLHGLAIAARISLTTYDRLPSIGQDAQMYTRLFVRDEQFELFGFATRDERWIFEELISVSGVGPKLALTLLSGMPVEAVRETIATGDSARLKAVRGIGAKIADRVVLELGKKFSGSAPEWTASASTVGAPAVMQARQALLALGLSLAEVEKSLESARGQDIDNVEDLIKFALRKG